METGNFSADDDRVIVFVTDTNTGETQILQELQSTYYLIPCSMEFTDEDTTLTITQYADNHPFTYRAEKIRISDGKVLWQTNTPEEEFEYYAHYMKWLDWLHFDDYLLLGAQRVLYALNLTTGEIIDIEHMDSNLIRMERLDQDTFSIILEDGTYTTGHISKDDLDLHTNMAYLYDPVPVMELGEVWDVLFINGGYLRGRNGTELRPTTISSENGSPCCVAIIPQQDDWKMIIRQAVPYYPILGEKELYTYHAPNYNVGYRLSTNICGADTLVLIDNEDSLMCQYMFYDRTTLESKDCFIEDGLHVYSFLKDGTAALCIDDNGILCIYDRFSQKATHLSPIDGTTQMLFDGHLIESTILGCNYGQLAKDHSLATVVATEHGLLMWLDDQKQPAIPFPAELSINYPKRLTKCELRIHENGFIQLDLLDEDRACICNNYYLYSIWENEWYSFPIGKHPSDCRNTCLGGSEPTFTVMDDTGTVRVYDMASGDETLHFNISIDPSTIHNMQWIMDDCYLAVRVGQDQVFILDGTTGEIVFSHTATMINHATDK